MHPLDVKDALDSLVILLDTREQDTGRLRTRLMQTGRPFERKKLDFGDYSAKVLLPSDIWHDFSKEVVIERKMSIDELCQCYTRDRPRFEREFERAQGAGAKIYLLVENASWEMVYAGKYRSQMTSPALVASVLAWLARYECQVIFCKAETSGYLIRDILYREVKERLLRFNENDESGD